MMPWLSHLRRDLLDPDVSIGPDEAAAVWSWQSVIFACERPAGFIDYPDLSLRIRGAWGRHLREAQAPTRRSVEMPVPVAILHNSLGNWASGLELPKPAIIRAWLDGGRIFAEVRLFGWACVYLDAAADALAAALEGGVSPTPVTRQRVKITIMTATEKAGGIDPIPARFGSASLSFRTPVAVRQGNCIVQHPSRILKSALTRVSGMARWQGVSIDADWPALHAVIDALDYDDKEMTPVRWTRHSIRQKGRDIPIGGAIGRLRFDASHGVSGLSTLLPFIAMAQTCNIGSHAALGLGWFDAAIYP